MTARWEVGLPTIHIYPHLPQNDGKSLYSTNLQQYFSKQPSSLKKLEKLVNRNYNKYMNSILGTVASYQAINNFYVYDSLRIGDSQDNTLAPIDSNAAPIDDNAAYASISPEAIALYNTEQQSNSESEEDSGNTDEELTQQEKQEVSELKMTDTEVRAHENAHKAAAAGLTTSAPNYEYETGPDGKKYAVAGDVNVSYQHSDDPEVNLRNAQQLKASALAPADPSSQDRKVAAQADREIAQARQEILEEQNRANEEDGSGANSSNTNNINSTEPENAQEIAQQYHSYSA